MRPIPIPIRTNPAEYRVGGSPRLVNCYAEMMGPDNKAPYTIVPCAGAKQFSSESGGTCRGMIYSEDTDSLYVVRAGQLHKIEEDETATLLGFIEGTQSVTMARNNAVPQDIVICSENRLYRIKGDVFEIKTLPIEDGQNPLGVTYHQGYLVYYFANGRFYASELASVETDGTRFATAEGHPDGLKSAIGLGNALYLIGNDTTEVWAVSGGATFPFARVGGTYLEIGTESPNTVRAFNNGAVWVGADNVVYFVNGYQYEPISSPEVARLIEADPNRTRLVGFTHERGLNKFYTLQGTGWTREYNAQTKEWHSRENVLGNAWHMAFSANAWGKTIMGDRADGRLFELDYNLFTDDDEELPWAFDTTTINAFPDALSFEKLWFDMEVGDGLDYQTPGEVMLSWSDDTGVTFKQERRLPLGVQGNYTRQVKTSRLGRSGPQGRVFRLRVTDPVVRSIASVQALVSKVAL